MEQPLPQGLLALQYGGGRREDPGTQHRSRDRFITESGNLFKMAAKIKSERIWVQGLETGEKQTKWRQRQTRRKLQICKNALKGYRNTVEWYILFSVPWPSFVLSLNVLAYTALYNCLQLNFSTPASFQCFLFVFAYPECQRFSFLLSWKGEPFLTVSAIYFMLRISRTDLWSQGIFCHDSLKLCPPNFTWEFIDSQIKAFINYR